MVLNFSLFVLIQICYICTIYQNVQPVKAVFFKYPRHLTLKLPGEGQIVLPLEILAYSSNKKRQCVIEFKCNFIV